MPRHAELTIEAGGTVETRDCNGVVAGLANAIRRACSSRETPQTRPDAAICELADRLEARTRLERLHDLVGAVRDRVEYVAGATDAHRRRRGARRPAKAYAGSRHIFIAAARTLGVPARYVTGYLVVDTPGSLEAHHAWAEAWVEGLGWVGFDVANRICPTERYVRLAVGLDARMRPPSSARAAAAAAPRSSPSPSRCSSRAHNSDVCPRRRASSHCVEGECRLPGGVGGD